MMSSCGNSHQWNYWENTNAASHKMQNRVKAHRAPSLDLHADFEHHDFYFLTIPSYYETQKRPWHYHPVFSPVIPRRGSWAEAPPDRHRELSPHKLTPMPGVHRVTRGFLSRLPYHPACGPAPGGSPDLGSGGRDLIPELIDERAAPSSGVAMNALLILSSRSGRQRLAPSKSSEPLCRRQLLRKASAAS